MPKSLAEDFLSALNPRPDAKWFFQSLDDLRLPDGSKRNAENLCKGYHGTLKEHEQELIGLNEAGAGIFVQINANDGKGSSNANITHIRAFYADYDNGIPKNWKLTPSLVVSSSLGKAQVYWFLENPISATAEYVREYTSILRTIHIETFSDGSATDLRRVLRLPGFLHCKNPAKPHFIDYQEKPLRYAWDQVSTAYPPSLETKTVKVFVPEELWPDLEERTIRATSYLSKIPFKKDGEGHNAHIYHLASILDRDFAMPELHGLAVLQAYELRSPTPPKPEEVERIYRNATRYASGTRGSAYATPAAVEILTKEDISEDTTAADAVFAKMLVERHRQAIRYCEGLGGWLAWDGRRWARNGEPFVQQHIIQMLSEIGATKANPTKFTERYQSYHTIVSIMRLARNMAQEPLESFDAHPFLLNVRNGTIDLRTGSVSPHQPLHFITTLAPVDYKPIDCPIFKAFLEQVMGSNTAHIDFLHRWIGYCLTGDTSAQTLLIAIGGGRNGKSTLMKVITDLLGDYAVKAPASLLMEGERHPAEMMTLMGKRFAFLNEVDKKKQLNEQKLKDLVGGDKISARAMRKDFIEFLPTFKLNYAVNQLPNTNDQSMGMWRRVLLLPFDVTIAEGREDPELDSKLKTELPGILHWAVQGGMKWYSEGKGREGLRIPQSMILATNTYRNEMDFLSSFLEDCCDRAEDLEVGTGILYATYVWWCTQSHDTYCSKVEFGKALKERGFKPKRGAKGSRMWAGLKIGDAFMGKSDAYFGIKIPPFEVS